MEWIPCTERLPEKSGCYLVTRKFSSLFSLLDDVFIVNYSELIGVCVDTKIWWIGSPETPGFEELDDVVAWMPLPEPYKTDTESYETFTELYKIFTENEKVCKGCHYNDGGVHAECIVCDNGDKRKEDDSTVPAHWIDQGHKVFKCSNCGNYLDFRGVNAGRGTANYCPNCGAKMWNIWTRKPQKGKAMFFKKTSKQKLTKREEEIRDYIVNEYGEALYVAETHNTPETLAREDEASKILEKILDILGYKEEKMSDE